MSISLEPHSVSTADRRPAAPGTPRSQRKSQPKSQRNRRAKVRPSKVDPADAGSFTLDQELKVFGRWSGDTVWVPPKDSSEELAETMLAQDGWFQSKEQRWSRVVQSHRQQFTEVREIELEKPSIRLPKGKLYVQVTQREDFDEITDEVPACVQTRLDEFLERHGNKKGVRVHYLKPLCVEMDHQLHFTSHERLMKTINKIRREVFSHYRFLYLPRRTQRFFAQAWNVSTAFPRGVIRWTLKRQQRAIDAYHAKLEFERRKTALRALKAHQQCRTNEVSYNEMLDLTNPLRRDDVITQFSIERELSPSKTNQLLEMAAGQLPWFAAFSMGLSAVGTFVLSWTTSVAVCDPAFVAEFPDSPGTLWNIGHFDEIDGVRHVEI